MFSGYLNNQTRFKTLYFHLSNEIMFSFNAREQNFLYASKLHQDSYVSRAFSLYNHKSSVSRPWNPGINYNTGLNRSNWMWTQDRRLGDRSRVYKARSRSNLSASPLSLLILRYISFFLLWKFCYHNLVISLRSEKYAIDLDSRIAAIYFSHIVTEIETLSHLFCIFLY